LPVKRGQDELISMSDANGKPLSGKAPIPPFFYNIGLSRRDFRRRLGPTRNQHPKASGISILVYHPVAATCLAAPAGR